MVVRLSAITVTVCVLVVVCPSSRAKNWNELLEVRFQRCLPLPLPHDSCALSKHLLARRSCVEPVPVVCVLNQTVGEQFILGPTSHQEKSGNRSTSTTILNTNRKRAVSHMFLHFEGLGKWPRFAGPFYIEDWEFIVGNLNANGSGLEFKPNGSEG